ncbi:hypothetical protein C8J56DRAFT_903101 [Mycena floridula]|nr:hypothetical protein C8J56DRAFT_903101 [Mycena floridula]
MKEMKRNKLRWAMITSSNKPKVQMSQEERGGTSVLPGYGNLWPRNMSDCKTSSRIPIIVGGTLGVIVVLMMTMGLLVIRHHCSRLLKIPVTPYELSRLEDAGAQSQMLRGVLNWQKRHLQINNPTDITGNGAEIPSEKATITTYWGYI